MAVHGDSRCEIHTCRTSLVVARLIYYRAATLDNCHSRRSLAPREPVISVLADRRTITGKSFAGKLSAGNE